MQPKQKGAFISIAVTAILLFVYYHFHIINANHLALSAWGDGYKNYYTLAYYLANDHGTHFTGMNYPYGENIIFTDNQPLLAFILSPLVKLFPGLVNYLHGITVYILFAGMLLCSWAVYVLLFELGLPYLFAAIVSSLIALLSPNWGHFLGLYSLAYVFYLPVLLLLLYRFLMGQQKVKQAILLTLFITGFSFIHLYTLAFALFVIAGVVVVLPLFSWKEWRALKFDIPALLLIVAVPFAAVKLYLLLTDSVTDRPSAPWGYFDSCIFLYNLVLYPNSYLLHFLQHNFPEVAAKFQFREARCFLGLVPVFIVLAGVVYTGYHLIRGRLSFHAKHKTLLLLLVATIPALLFSLAFPFSYDSMKPWYEKLPETLKQFRGAGRFSWPFYYAFTIAAALVLWKIAERLSAVSKKLSYGLVALFCLLWFVDVNTTNNFLSAEFKKYSYFVDEQAQQKGIDSLLHTKGYSTSSFQAIFPMPFFSLGSEKLSISSPANYEAMVNSLATGLPLASAQLSRTSISQAFKVAGLLNAAYIPREILKDLPNNKPMLAMVCTEQLRNEEQLIISKSEYLFTYNETKYYKLPLAALEDSTRFIRNSVDFLLQKKPTALAALPNNCGVVSIENREANFPLIPNKNISLHSPDSPLYYNRLPNEPPLGEYEVSVWIYANPATVSVSSLRLEQYDSTGKNKLDEQLQITQFKCDTYKSWARATIKFNLLHPLNVIRVYVEMPGTICGSLLIRPVATTVVSGYKYPEPFLWNNYPIP